MARKCPPGVICIENVTITFLIFLIGLIGLYFYYKFSPNQPTVIVKRNIVEEELRLNAIIFSLWRLVIRFIAPIAVTLIFINGLIHHKRGF